MSQEAPAVIVPGTSSDIALLCEPLSRSAIVLSNVIRGTFLYRKRLELERVRFYYIRWTVFGAELDNVHACSYIDTHAFFVVAFFFSLFIYLFIYFFCPFFFFILIFKPFYLFIYFCFERLHMSMLSGPSFYFDATLSSPDRCRIK